MMKFNRKFLAFLLVVLLSVSSLPASAEVKAGKLTMSLFTEEEFSELVPKTWLWSVLDPTHDGKLAFKYYDSMTAMMLALNSGEIDEIDVSRSVGEYMTAVNPDYYISCVMRSGPVNYSFGFLSGDKGLALRDKFDEAVRSLMVSGRFAELQEDYIYDADFSSIAPVKFSKFDGAETIKVAITGDLPPIDYVDAGGNAAGFNTAILAEIGRTLGLNIELVNIGHSAKTAALTSGRVDVVFWYMYISRRDGAVQLEIPEKVILSNPYYMTDIYVHVRKKK